MKTVKAKLYPTPLQERAMLRFLDAGRWVYNRALEQRIKAYRRRGESVQYAKQQALLTKWRSRMEWLRLAPLGIERDALRRVDRGMQAFFRRVKAGQTPGFPRFKGRDRWRSFEVLQPGKYLRSENRVHITGIGQVKYRGMNGFVGDIKGLRVVRKERGWYVQLIIDDGAPPSARPVERRIGIDVGLSSFATLSNGEKIDNPQWYRQSQCRLRFLQRIASRRKKGSQRRRKAYARVARFHERIADTRRDWIHKLTRQLVNEHDLLAVENLNIKGLSRSRLAKSILDAAWGQFLNVLTYKAENAGAKVVRVAPRNTSQECSGCGATVPKTLSDRVHACSCGLTLDRDVNAARNILRRATAEVTRGESTLTGPADSAGRRGSRNREVLRVAPLVR
jgi:putative transposase